jgi:hypothetical protein
MHLHQILQKEQCFDKVANDWILVVTYLNIVQKFKPTLWESLLAIKTILHLG